MDVDVNVVLQLYKEELANTKDELILRKALQVKLEREIVELKERIKELEG